MKHNEDIFYDSSDKDVFFDDYLLLGGGTDIDPGIYGEIPLSFTQAPDIKRDKKNLAQIGLAHLQGKPVIGICRGAQLLDACNGGKLIQHSVGHSSSVDVEILDGYKVLNLCAADHHQLINIDECKGEIIGLSNYWFKAWYNELESVTHNRVPHIIWYPEHKHLGIQFHPEWHVETHNANVYLRKLIKTLLNLTNVL